MSAVALLLRVLKSGLNSSRPHSLQSISIRRVLSIVFMILWDRMTSLTNRNSLRMRDNVVQLNEAPLVYFYSLSLLGNRQVDDPKADGTVVCYLPPSPDYYNLWKHHLVSHLHDSLVMYCDHQLQWGEHQLFSLLPRESAMGYQQWEHQPVSPFPTVCYH